MLCTILDCPSAARENNIIQRHAENKSPLDQQQTKANNEILQLKRKPKANCSVDSCWILLGSNEEEKKYLRLFFSLSTNKVNHNSNDPFPVIAISADILLSYPCSPPLSFFTWETNITLSFIPLQRCQEYKSQASLILQINGHTNGHETDTLHPMMQWHIPGLPGY